MNHPSRPGRLFLWASAKWCLALLLGWILVGSPPTARASETNPAESFLPAAASVVLLPGLAGDVESERTYAGQLAGWLEILANARPAVRETFVFSDNPESVKLPAGFSARVLRTSRPEFSSLGQQLRQGTNPLVVIVWGHGGMQGNTPVFHVRGPRLTPADFTAWLNPANSRRSLWVLLYRGSGRFAAALNQASTTILASEKETIFGSDPVGMELLLQSLKRQPGLGWRAVAAELGRATGSWYRERNLARTEEPSLWTGGLPPQLLAPPEPTQVTEATENSAPATNPPPRLTLTTTNLSTAWQDLSRTDPREYLGADAVVLRRRISYTLGGNPAVACEAEEFIQILTAEGKRAADFDFAYSPPEETITFLDCEILQPDGRLLTLDPDSVHDAAESAPGDYHTARRKIFSLPGVSPGSVLHVHYRNEWKSFPLPHVSLAIPLLGDSPVRDLTVQISLPRDDPFHFALDGLPARDPSIKQSPYGTTYTWAFSSLPADEPEPLTPPHRAPGLLISTFPDWAAFADWFGRITRLTDELTPELRAKAQELTVGRTTDRERIRALFDYVTGLRYVAVPLGVNSFRPHAAANVLGNQFGDCKDKANLLNTLLHALNLEAHLVLVPRFSQADENLPGFAFNHAISQVRLGTEVLWLDTTDDICRFGMLPPGDPGRKVLVVDAKSPGLVSLPSPEPRAHRLELRGTLDLAADADAPPVKMVVTAVGFADYQMRTAAQGQSHHPAALPLLAAHFFPVTGAFGATSQSHSPVSDLGADFLWQAGGGFAGLLTVQDGHGLLRTPFWVPREWEHLLHRRRQPFFLNQGYPLRLDQEYAITLPEGAREIRLPAPRESAVQPLSWRVEWQNSAAGLVTVRFRVEIARGDLAAADTPALQGQWRALLSALGAALEFNLPPGK